MSRPPRRFALCNPAHGMTLPEVKAAIKSYLKMADILIRYQPCDWRRARGGGW